MTIDPHVFGGTLSVGAFVALGALRRVMRLVRIAVFVVLLLVGGGVLLGVLHLPGAHTAVGSLPATGR